MTKIKGEIVDRRVTISLTEATQSLLNKLKKGKHFNTSRFFNELAVKEFNSPARALFKKYRMKYNEMMGILQEFRDLKEEYEKDGKNILDEIKEPKIPYFEEMDNIKKEIEKDEKLKKFFGGKENE